MHGVAPFPLYWPLQHPRTPRDKRRTARFQVGFSEARSDLLLSLQRLKARDVVLSSQVPIRRDGLPNVPDREPDDPGVAVYFSREGAAYVIACDAFQRIRWNLRAIGETVNALRAIERHATSTILEQAFSGFAQLPAPGSKPWRDVLGLPPDWPPPGTSPSAARASVEQAFRELAVLHHPDVGGNTARMAEINGAREAALREVESR